MMHVFDRYIIRKLFTITVFILTVLIFIFIIIDFSENSDDFTDEGATMEEIWGDYYLNYIPEMTRLVIPVAVFTACLFLTGQLSERLEITALKAAGISLYRLSAPFIIFSLGCAVLISTLDAYIIPDTNAKRINFEKKYISKKSDQLDKREIFRQIAPGSILKVNYFDTNNETAYRVRFSDFDEKRIQKLIYANKMKWQADQQNWLLENIRIRVFTDSGFVQHNIEEMDTTISVFPRDLARSTTDIYQLTYPEAQAYIASIQRSGAGGVELPKVQFYGRLAYPFSIIVVTLIGFALASVRRRGGKGFYIAAGLTISFMYLAFQKIAEPFGHSGAVSPVAATLAPHIIFLLMGIILLFAARK